MCMPFAFKNRSAITRCETLAAPNCCSMSCYLLPSHNAATTCHAFTPIWAVPSPFLCTTDSSTVSRPAAESMHSRAAHPPCGIRHATHWRSPPRFYPGTPKFWEVFAFQFMASIWTQLWRPLVNLGAVLRASGLVRQHPGWLEHCLVNAEYGVQVCGALVLHVLCIRWRCRQSPGELEKSHKTLYGLCQK